MWFMFIGNPHDLKDDARSIKFGGVVFEVGESVEVTDEKLQAKLLANSHFKSAGADEDSPPLTTTDDPPTPIKRAAKAAVKTPKA